MSVLPVENTPPRLLCPHLLSQYAFSLQVSSAHVFTLQLLVSAACQRCSAPSHVIIAPLTVHIFVFSDLSSLDEVPL